MNKAERAIIFPVTVGSMLEWYEVYLYIYWSPIIARNLFDVSLPMEEFVHFIMIISVGFIARPLGGFIFGFIGDRWGRKRSFLFSIFLVFIPSFCTAFMPSFRTWNLFLIIYIGIMKFIQGIPSGGETAGAMCFLSESAAYNRRRYLCSYALVGPQIGQIASMVQCLLFEKYFSFEFLIKYGWRLSFFIAGIVGVFGYFLRKKLPQSQEFRHLKEKHLVLHNPIKQVFKNYKKKIMLGFLISISAVVGFYLIAFFIVENAGKIFKLNLTQNLLTNIIFLSPIIVILPIIGKIGDRYKNRSLYVLSAVGIIVISVPFYFAVSNALSFLALVFLGMLILFLCIQFALLPSLLTEFYPAPVRFTCLGLSFNVCDGVIGGFVSLLGIYLMRVLDDPAAFIIIYPISAIIFLITLPFIKTLDKSVVKK